MTTGNPQSAKHGQKPTKVCSSCNEEKPRESFYKHKETKDRLRSECKLCWNNLAAAYYTKNKEKRKPKAQDYHYRHNYGISYKEFLKKKEAQNNRCVICNRDTDLVQDHCHTTNTLRSLLCNPCNQGLGSFYDNPELLRKAANYLEKEEY